MKKAVNKKAVKKKPTQKIEYKISLEDLKSGTYKEQEEKEKTALLADQAREMLVELFQLPHEVESFIVIACGSKKTSLLSAGDLNVITSEMERAKLQLLLEVINER